MVSEHIVNIIALCKTYPDGERLHAVALEYDKEIDNSRLTRETIYVDGRDVAAVHASSRAAIPRGGGENGKFVVVQLNAMEDASSLYHDVVLPGSVLGREEDSVHRLLRRPAFEVVCQCGDVYTVDGDRYPGENTMYMTNVVGAHVADAFQQKTYVDPESGERLKYNLYVTDEYDPARSYPLLMFLHDQTVCSEQHDYTLSRCYGATIFASHMEQVRHAGLVIAPQYPFDAVNADGSMCETYAALSQKALEEVLGSYSVDPSRIYITGQDMGCSAALDLLTRNPGFYAAALLISGTWMPADTAPLADQKLLIVSSVKDEASYACMSALAERIRSAGGTVRTNDAFDDAWTQEEARAALDEMDSSGAGTLLIGLLDASGDAAFQHENAWRKTYDMDAARDWVYAQRRQTP